MNNSDEYKELNVYFDGEQVGECKEGDIPPVSALCQRYAKDEIVCTITASIEDSETGGRFVDTEVYGDLQAVILAHAALTEKILEIAPQEAKQLVANRIAYNLGVAVNQALGQKTPEGNTK